MSFDEKHLRNKLDSLSDNELFEIYNNHLNDYDYRAQSIIQEIVNKRKKESPILPENIKNTVQKTNTPEEIVLPKATWTQKKITNIIDVLFVAFSFLLFYLVFWNHLISILPITIRHEFSLNWVIIFALFYFLIIRPLIKYQTTLGTFIFKIGISENSYKITSILTFLLKMFIRVLTFCRGKLVQLPEETFKQEKYKEFIRYCNIWLISIGILAGYWICREIIDSNFIRLFSNWLMNDMFISRFLLPSSIYIFVPYLTAKFFFKNASASERISIVILFFLPYWSNAVRFFLFGLNDIGLAAKHVHIIFYIIMILFFITLAASNSSKKVSFIILAIVILSGYIFSNIKSYKLAEEYKTRKNFYDITTAENSFKSFTNSAMTHQPEKRWTTLSENTQKRLLSISKQPVESTKNFPLIGFSLGELIDNIEYPLNDTAFLHYHNNISFYMIRDCKTGIQFHYLAVLVKEKDVWKIELFPSEEILNKIPPIYQKSFVMIFNEDYISSLEEHWTKKTDIPKKKKKQLTPEEKQFIFVLISIIFCSFSYRKINESQKG